MTIKDLKKIIASLPDDMKIFVDLDLEDSNPHDGCATADLEADVWNGYLYVTAKYGVW